VALRYEEKDTDRMPERIEKIEPDWMRGFYSLALRLISAQGYLALGDTASAKNAIDEAVKIVQRIEATPLIKQTIRVV
jgi:hypothetical protein